MTKMEKQMAQADDIERSASEALRYQDLAFKRAMLVAWKAGLERVVLGVKIDTSPIPPSYKRYDKSIPIVVTQSVAGECVDMGRSFGQ